MVRTTVTLDADTQAILHRRMAERGVSFKQAINDAVREGMSAATSGQPFRTDTADLGLPTMSLDHALRIASELEDEEVIRRMRAGK